MGFVVIVSVFQWLGQTLAYFGICTYESIMFYITGPRQFSNLYVLAFLSSHDVIKLLVT